MIANFMHAGKAARVGKLPGVTRAVSTKIQVRLKRYLYRRFVTLVVRCGIGRLIMAKHVLMCWCQYSNFPIPQFLHVRKRR